MSAALKVIKNPIETTKHVYSLIHKYRRRRSNLSLATRIEIIRKRQIVKKARQLIEMSMKTPTPNTYDDDNDDDNVLHSTPIQLHDLTYLLEDSTPTCEVPSEYDSDDELTCSESDCNPLSPRDSLVDEEAELIDM